MNKQKYLDKVYKKKMEHNSIFKKVIMVCPNNKYQIVLNKVKDINLVDEYIAPLIEYEDEGYLIKPVNKFSFKKFANEIDVLVINSNMQILSLIESSLNKKIDFGFDFHSIIILPRGFIRLIELNVGDKIKFETLLYI